MLIFCRPTSRCQIRAVSLACSAMLALFACTVAVAQTGGSDSDGRHVTLEGQSNFRDLGGYRTRDGSTIKRGVVFRSGQFPHLSDADVKKLADLKIRTVVNFLTKDEIEAAGRDRLPAGAREISSPIAVGDNLAGVALEARKNADFSKLPPEVNSEVHGILTRGATEEYAKLFREIANSDSRPLVFHCSHGVHRTGTAAAILLWGLGVPWDTVREDYLLSNTCREEEVERRLEQLKQLAASKRNIAPAEVDMTNVRAFYILQGNYIDETRDTILEEYGSVDEYLTKGLGLSKDEITNLREQLLE